MPVINIKPRRYAPLFNPASTLHRSFRSRPSSFPTTERCPTPTRNHASTPSNLGIDYERPLNGTMATYVQQVLISTGKGDWTSRIEEDEAGELARGLKGLFVKGGRYSDASVFMHKNSKQHPPTFYPHFAICPIFHSHDSIETFARAFLLPPTLHPAHKTLAPSHRLTLTQQPKLRLLFSGAYKITDILILICGHHGRDERCGVMGPLLLNEFERMLNSATSYNVLKEVPANIPSHMATAKPGVKVGLISHVGGHKFAGNVIIYIPPSVKINRLAGKGIWYGRVKPSHIEGIIEETIVKGRVIGELFRGGIDEESQILRI
ncbi:MAG: hypothetical protein M1840_000869 [Geoglossum simile]|nr:MAG: hypothetical protein M1840_000869 [Geoglossum simile]